MLYENRRKLLTFGADDTMTRIEFAMELRQIWEAERRDAGLHPWLPGAEETAKKLDAAIETFDKLYLIFLMSMDELKKEIDAIRIDRSCDARGTGDGHDPLGGRSVPDATGDSRC